MTKTIIKTVVAVLAAALVFSCEKPPVPELSLSDKAANFNASGELSKTIQVTANYPWTATKSADWITLDKTSGESNGSFTITVPENKTFDVREGTVTVTSEGLTETVSVKQIAATPSLVASGDNNAIPAAGATLQIEVTSNVAWTVNVVVDWVTVDKTSGENNGVINVTVQENKSVQSRGVVLSIDGKDQKISDIVELNQLGAEPVLSVSPDTVNDLPAEGGTVQITVTSNLAWTVDIVTDWVTADKTSGENDGVINLQVQKNINPTRRGVVISIENNTYNVCDLVELTQLAAPLSRQTDSLALVSIYNASKGDAWTKGNWDLTKEISTWNGVKLNDVGRVTELVLTTKVAIPEEWTLPEDIKYLTELLDLRINKQKLTGAFPESVCDLAKLKILYLQGNLFTGALPQSIANLSELTQLYIDQNANMSGSLPKEIGQLKKLERLNISQSGIGGEIPVELGQCESLLQFMAFKCNLSGALPDIWDMPVLQTVMIHTNPGITGELPASLGKVKKISTSGPSIQLYGCNITGNIPESFAGLDGGTKKVQVQIQQNKMSGVVPSAVKAHKDFASWKINPQQDGYGLTTE